MSTRNRTKKEILETLERTGESTTGDLASILGRSQESIAMALLRYHRQGLVSRYTIEHNAKVYELTDRGHERLDYLRTLVAV
jgi:DNA-binding MarR family transcriptional regulator